jgi:hypothetical protein
MCRAWTIAAATTTAATTAATAAAAAAARATRAALSQVGRRCKGGCVACVAQACGRVPIAACRSEEEYAAVQTRPDLPPAVIPHPPLLPCNSPIPSLPAHTMPCRGGRGAETHSLWIPAGLQHRQRLPSTQAAPPAWRPQGAPPAVWGAVCVTNAGLCGAAPRLAQQRRQHPFWHQPHGQRPLCSRPSAAASLWQQRGGGWCPAPRPVECAAVRLERLCGSSAAAVTYFPNATWRCHM